jgi:hypothetical protein
MADPNHFSEFNEEIMSRLVDFTRCRAPDTQGRYLHDIWTWDDDALESVHDFIQWLFPLPEASQFNPDAPLLTAEDIAAFRTNEQLRANLRRSFDRILSFLGLAWDADSDIVPGPNFESRAADVWIAPNHNWLRITRILGSLRLLGLKPEAKALFARLEHFYEETRFPIPERTYRFWRDASQRN